jgi:hypothetical protein
MGSTSGKGLVIRPPRACRGETTANGHVQPDLLPLVIIYDDADTLDFGIAYLSEDAYESPLSILRFGGATIEKATRKEFDAFRRSQANLVTRESYWSALAGDLVLKRMNIARVAKPMAHVCEGYERYRIPEGLRPQVRIYWPSARPAYWLIGDYHAEAEIHFAILKSKLIQSDGEDDPPHSPLALVMPSDDATDRGFPTRTGGGLVSPLRGDRFPAAVYPASTDFRLDLWPADTKEWPNYIAAHDKLADVAVDFRDGRMKGFAYCYVHKGPSGGALKTMFDKRAVARIDKEYVFSTHGNFLEPLWIFERDEYAFLHFRIYLESTRGDV